MNASFQLAFVFIGLSMCFSVLCIHGILVLSLLTAPSMVLFGALVLEQNQLFTKFTALLHLLSISSLRHRFLLFIPLLEITFILSIAIIVCFLVKKFLMMLQLRELL